MDQSNYVGQNASGYIVVKGGQIVGTYGSQQEAEAAFNGGSGAAPPASTSYDPGAAAAATAVKSLSAQKAYQQALAQGASDRLAFDKATEAWNETFRQSQANNANALDYLGLASKLGGPANAFNYAHLLTGTPGGLADIVRAASGQYRLPAFGGGSGQQSTPQTIASIVQDVGAYSPTLTSPAPTTTTGQYQTVNGPKTIAQMGSELKTAGWSGDTSNADAVLAQYPKTTGGSVTPLAATTSNASTQTMMPGSVSTKVPGAPPPPTTGLTPTGSVMQQSYAGMYGQPATAAQIAGAGSQAVVPGSSTYTTGMALGTPTIDPRTGLPTSPAGTVNDPNNPLTNPTAANGYIPAYGGLPKTGNQFAPQNINAMDPSQTALLGAAYSDQGYNWADLMAQYQKSLRAYGGPAQGGVGF